MKQLSISVAAYNVEKTLKRTLDSFCDERFDEDLEVIIVNNGSSDRTQKIAEEYVNKFPNIFVLVNFEKNAHYGATINGSLNVASGRYYRTVDGDDWCDKDELYRFLVELKSITTDLVLSDYCKRYENNQRIDVKPFEKLVPNTSYSLDSDEVYKNSFTMHCMTVKTGMLIESDFSVEENCGYVDTEYMLKSIMLARNVIYLPFSVYQYSVGNIGQSTSLENYQKNVDSLVKVLNIVMNEYEKRKRELSLTKRKGWCFYCRKTIAEPCFSITLSLRNPKQNLKMLDDSIRAKSCDIFEELGRRPMIWLERRTKYLFSDILRIIYLFFRKNFIR